LLLDEIGHYRIAICYSASKPWSVVVGYL
jgi:hypothetical protein